MAVRYKDDHMIKGSIVARTRGLSPAYGLADHAAFREPYSTEISGYKSNYFSARSDNQPSRLISNFVVFPKQGLACINLEPHKKIVEVTKNALVQGTYYTNSMPALYYFIGSVKQIYADYLKVRNDEGYKVYQPKYAWFGVGWEAYGALGWHTNHETVTEDVDHYLQLDFPLSWMVVGSGFWPDDPRYFATTSFGLWDKNKYPDPKQFIDHFHREGLKFILGLRIAFIPNGPYTQEGMEKGYFIKKDGLPRLFKLGFPKPECYFLDASNAAAVKWYIGLCDKWKAFGVDGYKEDLYGYEIDGLPDDKLDPVNEALMDEGVYVMGRNGYVGSPMDISRYNDFNYNQDQDRGPVNGLAFAYSGFPYVYPDIIGGTGLTDKLFGNIEKQKIGKYLMREAQYAAVNPSLSFGYGPWNFDDKQILNVCRSAAQLHDRLHAYIYSAAIKTYKTGFPYTMTPLPLAYPQDTATYYRENDQVRGYQWLIGDALMATPLYGNDYAESNTRNIYLPEGKWIDYDNGKVYQGPVTLKDFIIPVDKTPLFVGGTGFVVEQIGGKLYGRVYPVGFEGETVFYGKDGQTASHITIKEFKDKSPVISDAATRKKIPATYKRSAWEFEFVPGHNYLIQ
jgi:alpha-glucosidase (family GH31 glycosyl hydrolase)